VAAAPPERDVVQALLRLKGAIPVPAAQDERRVLNTRADDEEVAVGSMDEAPWVVVTSRAVWRAWFEAHHATHGPIGLVTYKKHVADTHVPWGGVVREALCFGWIDSRPGKVDAERMRLWLTRRKPGTARGSRPIWTPRCGGRASTPGTRCPSVGASRGSSSSSRPRAMPPARSGWRPCSTWRPVRAARRPAGAGVAPVVAGGGPRGAGARPRRRPSRCLHALPGVGPHVDVVVRCAPPLRLGTPEVPVGHHEFAGGEERGG